MKKTKRTGRRVLSIILTVSMLLTTVVFFDIGATAAAASALSVTDNAEGDPVYLYVPEQIYLKPTLDSLKNQKQYTFEWFTDATINTATHEIQSLSTGEKNEGNFYFYYEHADQISVSYKYVDENFNDILAFTDTMHASAGAGSNYADPTTGLKFKGDSTLYSPSNTRSDAAHTKYTVTGNELYNQIITDGSLSPYLTAGSKNVYIEWLVRYTDQRQLDENGNPIIKTAKAFTNVYKPDITPVGEFIRTKNPQGNASFGQNITWISGVHGSETGSYYANSGTKPTGNLNDTNDPFSFVPFSNSDTSGTLVADANTQGVTARSYALFPDNWTFIGWDNKGSIRWFSDSTSQYFTRKTFNYSNNSEDATGVVWNDNAFYTVGNAPAATITIDASRYNNFNLIPNFTVGLMATDNEGAKASGAYYIADATGLTTESDQTNREKDKTDRGVTFFTNINADYVSAVNGLPSDWASETASEGVKYNGRYNRPIATPSSTTETTYKVKTFFFTHDGDDASDHCGGDTCWNFTIMPINATLTNKTALRAAYKTAVAKFGKIGVLEDGSSRYYNDADPVYDNFIKLFKAAGLLISSIDKTKLTVKGTEYTIDTLPAALNAATQAVESTRRTSTATARFIAVAKNESGKYVAQSVLDSGSAVADQTANYNFFDTVSCTAPEFSGYTYVGYAKNTSTAVGTVLPDDYQSLYTAGAPAATEYAAQQNVGYTLFYVPQDAKVTIDTAGGTYTLLKPASSGVPASVGTASSATVEGNDIVLAPDASGFVPFYADLTAGSSYILDYNVVGGNANGVQFKFVSEATGTEFTVGSNGVFNATETCRAYLKAVVSAGKELRASDLCLTSADSNKLYLETSTAYPANYTAPASPRTYMNYDVTGDTAVTVTSRYSTVIYDQAQMLPFYADLDGGYTYQFTYTASTSLNANQYTVALVSPNGNVYTADADGKITVAADDTCKAQLKVTYNNVTSVTALSLSDLSVLSTETKLIVSGKANDVITLGIPVKEGYKFDGWTIAPETGSTPSGTLTQVGTSDVYDYRFGVDSDKLTAAWASPTYAVVFRDLDGNVLKRETVNAGAAATAPTEVPALFGHTFAGWDTTFSAVNSDLYIEPVYDEIDITVGFDMRSLSMYQYHSDTVNAILTPEAEAGNIESIVWTSNKTNIATVEGNGTAARVTGVAGGTARITCTVTYDGRTYSNYIDVTVTKLTPTTVEIENDFTKKQYFVGDTFDPSGLRLKVTYSDGETVKYYDYGTTYTGITITLSSPTMGSAGTKTVTITYKEGTSLKVTSKITVSKIELVSAEIVTLPNKLEYYLGETEPDLTGMTVKLTYNNGDETILTADELEYEPLYADTLGTEPVYVYYDETDNYLTFNVTIKSLEVASIAVKTLPKTDYFVGDSESLAGLTLTVTYTDNSTEVVSTGFTCTGFNSATAGQKTITVTYEGKTTTYNVTVTAVELTSIAVKTQPAKTTYFVGDTADYTGLVITANYNNGTSVDLTEGFTLSGFSSATAGQKTITVAYGGKTTTFKMTVNPVVLTNITVKTQPAKTTYFEGENADYTGLVITANYNNGTSEDLTTGFTLSGYDSTPGQKTITVTYGGKTATFTMTVNAIELTGITVKTAPTKTQYNVGDEADYTGLVITATYNNGTSEDLTTGFTCTGFDTTTGGQKTVTVTYGGKTATFTVDVNDVVLTGITVKTAPAKTEYFVGDTADYTGLVITANYSNGTSEDLTEGFELTGFDSAAAGQKTVTVTYEGKTATFNMNVNAIELTGITVKTAPAKTTYFVGDTADYTGLVITAAYNNGTSADLTEGFTLSGFDSETAGQKTVTVNYEGKTATFNMTVNPVVLTGIAVKTMPNKTVYQFDETADYTGLVITASYNNGTSEDLTTGFTCTGFNSATAGQKTITVNYNGKTATFKVEVEYKGADYSEIDALVAFVDEINPDDYENYWDVIWDINDYIDNIDYDKDIREQDDVNAMADELQELIDMLVPCGADYTQVDAKIAAANTEIAKNIYTDASVADLQDAIADVVRGKSIFEQDDVDAMADAIQTAITALELKNADYSKLEELYEYVTYLFDTDGVDEDGTEYINFSDLWWDGFADAYYEAEEFLDAPAVKINEQALVDAQVAALQAYIDLLETDEPITPPTPVEETFEFVNGAEIIEGDDENYVFGFKTLMTESQFDDFAECNGTYYEVERSAGRYIGTGSIVRVYSESTDELLEEYIIIIYGDVDGNAKIDADDFDAVSLSLAGEADPLDGVYKLAANVYGTRATVNMDDADAIASVFSGFAEIDQTTGKIIDE